MKQLILAISIMGMAISACKKTVPNYTINSELYDKYAFKSGTYWIYQDSLSSKVDSYVVVKAVLQNTNQGNYTSDVYNITVSVIQIDTNNVKQYKYNWFFSVGVSGIGLWSNNYTNSYESNLEYDLFRYPPKIGPLFLVNVNDSMFVYNIYNTYQINGMLFYNTTQINHYSSVFVGGVMNHNDWFYISDNVGLIKFVFNHPIDSIYQSWKILRYNIVK